MGPMVVFVVARGAVSSCRTSSLVWCEPCSAFGKQAAELTNKTATISKPRDLAMKR